MWYFCYILSKILCKYIEAYLGILQLSSDQDVCEEAAKVGERHANGAGGTILRAHIDPEIVGGTTTRMKKPSDAWDTT